MSNTKQAYTVTFNCQNAFGVPPEYEVNAESVKDAIEEAESLLWEDTRVSKLDASLGLSSPPLEVNTPEGVIKAGLPSTKDTFISTKSVSSN
jgi:hypothetical protein